MARLAASLVVVPLVSPVKQGGYQPEVRRLGKLLYPLIHILLVPIHVSITVLLIQSHGGTFYSLSAHFFIQSEGDHDPLNTGRVGALGTPLYSRFNFRSRTKGILST
jgi:hypothetical protein